MSPIVTVSLGKPDTSTCCHLGNLGLTQVIQVTQVTPFSSERTYAKLGHVIGDWKASNVSISESEAVAARVEYDSWTLWDFPDDTAR